MTGRRFEPPTFGTESLQIEFQKYLQLEKYSRWKINIQSIFGRHKILYLKIKKNLIFEMAKNIYYQTMFGHISNEITIHLQNQEIFYKTEILFFSF
jgi:hypothetical protein